VSVSAHVLVKGFLVLSCRGQMKNFPIVIFYLCFAQTRSTCNGKN